jgi:hypothetical protein
MHRVRFPVFIATATVLFIPSVRVCATQYPSVAPLTMPSLPPIETADPKTTDAAGSLKVSLRLQDESPFLGAADLRLMPNEGYEVIGTQSGNAGETLFPKLPPGKYFLEVSAPGYLAVRLSTQIDSGLRQRTLSVLMKPRPMADKPAKPLPDLPVTSLLPVAANASPPASKPVYSSVRDFWLDHELELNVPPVDPAVSCPMPQVLSGVAQRMAEFVSNLEKFTATELVEHSSLNPAKEAPKPEKKQFAYVVTISQNQFGTFMLDEYRNGTVDPSLFPGNIATNGLSALNLIFHPILSPDFTFSCEGLGQSDGKPAWQVHFAQRTDRPVRIRSYRVAQMSYSEYIEGRAWIDPGNYQVLRFESELEKPIPQIQLTKEHVAVKYAPVEFLNQKMRIWLPQEAELYVERRGHRYHRRHVYTDFKLFNVDTAQNLEAPKGSYTFVNASDFQISGVLTVTPKLDAKQQAVTLKIVVPARGKVFKVVGPGKDVNLPATAVESAKFVHDGKAGWLTVESDLAQESLLDVIPETPIQMQE